MYRKLWKKDSIFFRRRLNKISDICKSTGQYEKAFKYYEEALDIYKNLDQGKDVAACLNNIGSVYQSQGQHEKAIKYFEDALGIAREPEQDGNTSISLNNIGNVYNALGQSDKALEYYEKALEVDRKLSEGVKEVLVSKNLNLYYRFYWNKHDKIIYPYEQVLADDDNIEKDTDIYRDLNRIGIISISKGKYKTAIEHFKESVSIIEELRKNATGKIRKRFLSDLTYAYQLLTLAYTKDNDAHSAFQTIELIRAKLLIERFASNERYIKKREKWIWPQEVEKIQKTLDDDTVLIAYANVNLENIVQIAITRKGITGKEISRKGFVRSSINKYDTQIKSLLINQHSLSENKNDFNNIVNYYGSLLREPPLSDLRDGGTDIKGGGVSPHKANAKEIGRGLYKLLIKPIEEHIKDKNT